jgi:hypothetical protein
LRAFSGAAPHGRSATVQSLPENGTLLNMVEPMTSGRRA